MTYGESKSRPLTIRLSDQSQANVAYIQEHGPRPEWWHRGGKSRTWAIELALKHYAEALRAAVDAGNTSSGLGNTSGDR